MSGKQKENPDPYPDPGPIRDPDGNPKPPRC